MTDRELMQMALDVLEKLNKDGWILADFEDEVYASIEALRARLAQHEPAPQREWQGLTEGETIELALSAFALPEVSSETREKIHRDLVIAMNDQDSRLMLFAANIEAKLKEKNT